MKRRAEEEGGIEVRHRVRISMALYSRQSQPGTRVTVYLTEVPKEAAQMVPGRPFTVFSLLQHEHKKTVLNFTVQRNTEYDGSVRSKDPLVLCVGPRRIRVNPIYSQHTRGGGKGANNVHKFERYLRHGVTDVATIYGPVVYGKQPCALLRETSDSQGEPVGLIACPFDWGCLPRCRSPRAGRDGQLPSPRYDAGDRQAHSLDWAPIQDPQKDSDHSLHVLQRRCVRLLLCSFISASSTNITLPQTTLRTSSRFSCTPNMVALDTSRNRLVRMGTSRRTLMGRSARWTRCACRFTSACSLNGARFGEPARMSWATGTMRWRSRGMRCCYQCCMWLHGFVLLSAYPLIVNSFRILNIQTNQVERHPRYISHDTSQ